MASKPKNTAKGRTAGGSSGSGRKSGASRGGSEVSFGSEVTLLVILAVCIIMFISNFGIGGFVGEKVSGFCFGLFGMMAYLFPICFFVGAAFFVSNKDNGIAIVKLTAGVVFVVFLCLFMELIAGDSKEYQVQKSFQYAVEHKSGGGAVGGLLASLLCPAIGVAGAYVADIIALIISLVLLTERSFLSSVTRGSRKVYDTAREDAARRREVKESRREEQIRRRTDRKVEGVALDTKIVPVSSRRSDNISELKLPKETEAFSRELREKLFSGQEDMPKRAVGNSGWGAGELRSAASILEMPVKSEPKSSREKISEPEQKPEPRTEQMFSGDIFSEPVVVEKVRRSPRKRKTELDEVLSEGTEQLWRPKAGDPLLTGDEPVVIHSEPSGGAGQELPEFGSHMANGFSEADFSEEAFAGLESAIIAETDHSLQTEPEQEEEPVFAETSDFRNEMEETEVSKAVSAGITQTEAAPEPEVAPEPEETSRQAEQAVQPGMNRPEASSAAAGASSAVLPAPKPELPKKREYVFPPVSLLKKGTNAQGDSRKHLQETALLLQQTLKNFGVNVTITDVSCGPSVTRYEMQPEMGVKVSKIVNLADDIKLNLAAADIRIEAPIPGKAAVGIEVPNKENVMVRFRDMIETDEFQSHKSRICFTAGKDIGGQAVVADIAKMPHLLIAGATGSGKSVCINTIIMSILYKADPEDVKLILIDPKVVELSVYNGIPHLLIPVVTDPKKAAGALHWAVAEMMDRYQKFAECQVRDLKGYNQKIAAIEAVEDETKPVKMPQIIVIVDELADLMMVAPGDVEDAICRLAQLARAAGIHLIIATQRPSVDVITGLIKANMPSRIAFSVSSGVDSRTILDMNGAEKLLGNGDMLFYPQGYQKPLRVQGPFVSDPEVEAVVDFLKKQNTVVYNSEIEQKMNTASSGSGVGAGGERDAYFVEAGKFVIEKEKGSIGMLQRMFKVGFNRAARIMDQLEEAGVVGPEEGTKPRKVQMSLTEFEEYVEEHI
ncbi:MAG: DNA translocase FtsK [Lachnospiraceae bacterium]|nr:DNA translocase FtsK [Lachnospiraceae bacterium]